MSTPMTAAQFTAACALWGVKVKQVHTAWQSHNRAGHGAWGPVNGLVLHHTGSDGDDYSTLWEGRSDLPGPLCNWAMSVDGYVEPVGWGRANHAGSGSSAVLQHVIAENYTGNLHPGADNTDGNSHFYGQETMYSGGHVMSHAQYVNTLRVFAAVCHFHGWSAKSAIGHKEWTARKVDPGHLDMSTFRADLQKVLAGGPGKVSTTAKF